MHEDLAPEFGHRTGDEIVVPDFAITGPDKMRTLERFNTEVLGN